MFRDFYPKPTAGPWLSSFGTTDQYKRIFNPKNGIDEEVGKVVKLVDVAQQLPDTTICPPPKNHKNDTARSVLEDSLTFLVNALPDANPGMPVFAAESKLDLGRSYCFSKSARWTSTV